MGVGNRRGLRTDENVKAEKQADKYPRVRGDRILLPRSLVAYLRQLLLDRHNSLGTIRTERGKHRVDIGVHLKKRLYHLAYSRCSRVCWKDLRSLFHVFHLLPHNCKDRAFAEAVDARIVRLRLQNWIVIISK